MKAPLALLAALFLGVSAWAQTNIPIIVTPGSGTSNEEFVGPFANWINAQTGKRADGTGSTVCTAATGDGSTDDTAALQSCITYIIANQTTAPVLYLPAPSVNYKITACLHIGASSCTSGQTGAQYISIIGADPATTTIKWTGSAGGTMLAWHGLSYSKLSRITFDANNSAAIAVDQDWDNVNPNFDTGNEWSDVVFKNATSIGFKCGATAGCADTSMLRDQFIGNLTGGWVGNQNALNLYFWYSLFQNNSYGVSNLNPIVGSGNFHVFNSVFLNQLVSDISYSYVLVSTIRNNYSIGAGAGGGASNPDGHFIWCCGSSAMDPVIVQGNTVLDWTPGNPSFPQAVFQQDSGPLVLIDNVFRNAASNASAPVVSSGFAIGSLFSMGNTFTTGTLSATCAGSSPVTILASGLCHSINDQVVSRSTVNPAQPTLPSTPPNNSRTIFEVVAGSSAATIQTAINNAVAAGTRSVVHLQAGAYSIGTTLTTPANATIQIIGDQVTLLTCSASPCLKLNGPSKVTLRDFRMIAGANDGIEINAADQVGARVFMQFPLVANTSGAGIFVDALDYTLVEMHDAQALANPTVGVPAVKVVGGPSAAAGTWLGGAVHWFTGLTAGDALVVAQSAGAHVYLGPVWSEEQSSPSTWRFVTGAGNAAGAVSIIGSPLSMATTPSVAFTNFLGKDAVVGVPMGAASFVSTESISGTATGSLNLGLGMGGRNAPYFNNTSTGGTTEFLNSIDSTNPAAPTILSETAINTPFLVSALQQMRTSQPSVPTALPASITDVQMYRVTVGSGVNNIHIKN